MRDLAYVVVARNPRQRSGAWGRGGRSHARILALGASLCVLLLAAAPARGATGHAFLSTLSEAPTGTALVTPAAVAVDRASGQVFVADPGAGVVDVFGSSSGYQTQFGQGLEATGVAVDEASGEVYVAEAGEDVVSVFEPDGEGGYAQLSKWVGAGTPEGAFGEVTGVAVDNSTSATDPHAGDVFVADAGSSAVYVFKPKPAGAEEAAEGSFVGALSGGRLEEPNGVAVDSASGRVLVADSVTGYVALYGSSGVFEKKLTGSGSPEGSFFGREEETGNVSGVGVDEASGEIYVAEGERRVVSQFSAEGAWIGWLTGSASGPFSEPAGVAVASSGDVYVADAGARAVDVFGPDVIVPSVRTSAALSITKTSAVLHGIVNGEGNEAKYSFQWGESEALGSETPVHSAGSGEEAISSEISSLTAGGTYFFRLRAVNENGVVNYGATYEFQSRPAVEALATGPVSSLTPTAATLTGTLDPRGVDAHYLFQWGRTTVYGQTSPEVDAGMGKQALEASSTLSGLSPNTVYHYRLVANDEYGITYGEDAQFTTAGPPRVLTEAANVEGHEAASLRAHIRPDELETTYRFQWGETTAYGSEAQGKLPAGTAGHEEQVSAALTGLRMGVTYHYRIIAENSAGTRVGPDQTFTTIGAAPVEGVDAANISASEATLEAEIDPLGRDTTYFFQYGVEPCKPNPAGCVGVPSSPLDIGSGDTGLPESQRLGGLRPQTTYHYRVIAANSLGTEESPERTFTTREGEAPLALPDGRAWEMVSPPDKHGAPIEALTREGGLILASEDGNSLTYVADGAISGEPQGNRAPEMQQVLARRGVERWESEDIATPNTNSAGYRTGAPQEYQFFTPDLEQALVEPYGFTPFSEPPLALEATQKTIYIRDDATGAYLPLVTEANVPPGTEFGKRIRFLSATPDLSHVVIYSQVALTGPPSGPGLYEWETGGRLQFVSHAARRCHARAGRLAGV